MKFFLAIVSLLVIFGCGIMSLIFGLPERYIERDVKMNEMVGIWNITPDSEADIKEFVKKFPGWDAYMPLKTITLNDDGTCNIEFDEIHSIYTTTNNIISCSWDLGKERNLSDKISPILELDFEYSNNHGSMRSLYIYEEDNNLIIWGFIGDPDDFRTQDFVKVK